MFTLLRVWGHQPVPITATEKVTIFYDKPIVQGRYADGGAIKPDIIIWDKEMKTVKVIEVSVPGLDFNRRKSPYIKA